ncbi:hypothetical protein [Arenibacter amylolyticus]|uniref:hypothetical protein n=1 Tax=Arenibacter amylolyticus TaxID=1406873 RepID=UPI000A378A06|nr:hypothetical protein [Arenibacter amylolyticus]
MKSAENENLKASESAPMPTKQKDNIGVSNQTTNVPRTRFPWAMIAVVAVILIVLAFILLASG